jgi:hypothetical protein
MSNGKPKADTLGPGATTQPMMWFVIVTSIYFIIRYATSTKDRPDEETVKAQRIWAGVYMLLLIVGEFFINLRMSKALCGSNQWATTFYMTFAPWILIFGVINIMLLVFPGWIAPFSNTIGYGFTKLAGISALMSKIFRFKTAGEHEKAEDPAVAEMLGRIYADKGLLINEITQESFNDFWTNMWPLFRGETKALSNPPGPEGKNPLKHQLRSMVVLKDTVGMFCWYMLTGMLVTGVSYNYIMGAGCTRTAQEIKERHEQFLEEEAEVRQKKEAEGAPRVYTNAGR